MLRIVAYPYYDREADIAWFPVGESDDVVSERFDGGVRDYDRMTHEAVAVEVWNASQMLPVALLDSLPAPARTPNAAA